MKTHPDRHRITNCLGSEGGMFFAETHSESELRQGDVLLLCSDGLWGPLRPDEISAAFMVKPLEIAMEELMNISLYREGAHADNTTAVVVRWSDKEESRATSEAIFEVLEQ